MVVGLVKIGARERSIRFCHCTDRLVHTGNWFYITICPMFQCIGQIIISTLLRQTQNCNTAISSYIQQHVHCTLVLDTKANWSYMRLLGRHVYTTAYIYEGQMSISLPRKVLCDTSVRCLTACQHWPPVLFFHCILKYQAALVMARWCCSSCCACMMLTMNRCDVADGSR